MSSAYLHKDITTDNWVSLNYCFSRSVVYVKEERTRTEDSRLYIPVLHGKKSVVVELMLANPQTINAAYINMFHGMHPP